MYFKEIYGFCIIFCNGFFLLRSWSIILLAKALCFFAKIKKHCRYSMEGPRFTDIIGFLQAMQHDSLTMKWWFSPTRAVRTRRIGPHPRMLELPPLARPGAFSSLFCLKLGLRGSVFAVCSPPYPRERISGVLTSGPIIRVLTVVMTRINILKMQLSPLQSLFQPLNA